ncbi:hypothetical protein Scep_013758 [Stephania cephalantha]|uniref:Homeobox domain-containing protein n=1 Tax=Stephania cephalantha TaxID=152367 RepID=A0AAP0NYR1_9MAGN
MMEQHQQHQQEDQNVGVHQQGSSDQRAHVEPVRSRWTPKPEQIHILESIFNSGMVNPPRDETVRIRKLLEKFGSVSDANIFYWFQNRRSRTRRRQRQLKASSLLININDQSNTTTTNTNTTTTTTTTTTTSIACSSSSSTSSSGSCPPHMHLDGGIGGGADDLFCISPPMGLHEIDQNSSMNPHFLCTSSDINNPSPTLHYQSGYISVYINGVPTEVPRGAIDLRSMFGEDAMLVHSSGVPVPVNEFGVTLVSLYIGESYFLVSGPT